MAMIRTAITNPRAGQDLAGPSRDHRARVTRSALEKEFARLDGEETADGGFRQGPEPVRVTFRDAADLANCLGLAEAAEHQFRLARQRAAQFASGVTVSARGVPGTDPNGDGNYDVYLLYVRANKPDLLPRVGEQCEIELPLSKYTRPEPVDERMVKPETKADIIANHLRLAMDRAAREFGAYTDGFSRHVTISFARVVEGNSARVAKDLKAYPVKYFGEHASEYNQPYRDMLKRYVDDVSDEERGKVVTDWVKQHLHRLRLPAFDFPPTFKGRRVRIEGDVLPKLVSAAFLAYAPRQLHVRADGSVTDTPVRFPELPLLRDDEKWPDTLSDDSKFVMGQFVQLGRDPQLEANLWGVNGAAAATGLQGSWGRYLLQWSDRPGGSNPKPFTMGDYMDVVPRFVQGRQPRDRFEVRLYRLIKSLQANSRQRILSVANHPCGLVNICGGTTSERQKAVTTLLVAARLSGKRGDGQDGHPDRVVVLCPDAASADKQALDLHEMLQYVVEDRRYVVMRMSAGLPPDHKDTGQMDLYDEQLYLPGTGTWRLGRRQPDNNKTAAPAHGAELSLGDRGLQNLAWGQAMNSAWGRTMNLAWGPTIPLLQGVAVDRGGLLYARENIKHELSKLLWRSDVIVATPTELYSLRKALGAICDKVGVLAAMDAGKMTEAEWLVGMSACPTAKMYVMEGSLADTPASVLSRRANIINELTRSHRERRDLERARARATQLGVSPLKRAFDAGAFFINMDD